MLKISGAGWAQISIGDKVVYEGSYLTNIPCDFMKALYDYFNRNEREERDWRCSSSVYVDCEGGVANFVFSDMCYSGNGQKVFMFYPNFADGDWKIEAFDIDPYYLAVELISDIENDFENWLEFSENSQSARKDLKYWLKKLKQVIKDEKPYAEKLKAWNTPGTDEMEKVRKQAVAFLENDKNSLPMEHIVKHLPENETNISQKKKN